MPFDAWLTCSVPLTVPTVDVSSLTCSVPEPLVEPAARLVTEPEVEIFEPPVPVNAPKLVSRPSEKAPAAAVLVTDTFCVITPSPTWRTPKLIGPMRLDVA